MSAKNISSPNVIVLFSDQQRWDTTGVHGNPLDLTPNFDRVGQRGTYVNYALTCQPVCGPATACLQTGLYATTVGCHWNGIPLPSSAQTLSHQFGMAGYDTGYIGKGHVADEEPVPEGKRGGYDYWLASNCPEFPSEAYRTSMCDNDLLEKTIVAFTTDHGCHFKTRNDEYKRSCHENSIRSPMTMQRLGFDASGRIRQLVSLVDLPPTQLDASGLPNPEGMQGRSFPTLTRGETEGWSEDVFIQISESQVARAVRTHHWKYSVTAPNNLGYRDPSSDYYVEEFLYDLEADPHELTSLIGLDSHRAVTDRMRARLIFWMVKVGDPAPTIEPAPTRLGGQKLVLPEEVDA